MIAKDLKHHITMHSSSLWLARVKPSKKPKHIPSPVQARQGGIPLGSGSGTS